MSQLIPSANQMMRLFYDLKNSKGRQFMGQKNMVEDCCAHLAWMIKGRLLLEVRESTYYQEKVYADLDLSREKLLDLCIRLDVDNLEEHLKWLS